jgi:xanthine dehydrogenase YagT iron-sulfur-binding subunit
MNKSNGSHKERGRPSRRDFLKGSSAAAAVGALATTPLPAFSLAADQGGESIPAMGPGPVKTTLTVNGKQISHALQPRVTLLDALRNHLDVTGCKRVCDRGTCGACTVMLDGKPIYSCTMLAIEAQGHEIQTAEALGSDKLDAVPAAFVEHDAQQCGFCTPGFVVAMRAAFNKNPSATPAQIEDALSGNICRCGTYQQMRNAIAALCKTQGRGV